jgi:hypothetical protein
MVEVKAILPLNLHMTGVFHTTYIEVWMLVADAKGSSKFTNAMIGVKFHLSILFRNKYN